LSWSGTDCDAEWAPVVEKEVPAPLGKPGPPTKTNVYCVRCTVYDSAKRAKE
jgi:hypothetical protein